MSDDTQQNAPILGKAKDVSIGEETAVFLMNGGKPPRRDPDADADAEKTVDIPDEPAGTGGEPGGGAG
ncbi:MAG: hypothetical protein QOJ03_1888 [Frankiaceae bacterium]|jgi:hypothetical protein|nr:hypothetical protein [Frankiaceae bacterium]